MKKILNGPTVWRAKCPCCDCEFEYDTSEIERVYNVADASIFRVVHCPNCKISLRHLDSAKTTTKMKKEDTMST
jgi:hypothetical protein